MGSKSADASGGITSSFSVPAHGTLRFKGLGFQEVGLGFEELGLGA